jgi:5-methylcytosine-specific restriction endonuclease McrA
MAWKHGTIGGYSNHGCRCEACCRAWADYQARWRLKNLEKSRQSSRTRTKQWRINHPDEHRALCRATRANRRAQQRDQFVEPIDPQSVFERDEGICGICGNPANRDDFHVDHVIPLSRGGSHAYSNVQTAHPLCNLRKGTIQHQEKVCQIR